MSNTLSSYVKEMRKQFGLTSGFSSEIGRRAQIRKRTGAGKGNAATRQS